MMSWIYLLIAAAFEALWVFCVKFIDWSAIKKFPFSDLKSIPHYITTIYPLVGYIAFGILNVYFFSIAMRNISASVSLAVWMSTSLIFVKLIEVFYFSEAISTLQLGCFVLIIVGVIGLKFA